MSIDNMSMYDSIKNFHKQFSYAPKVENVERLKKYERFVIVGMGGSGLAAELLLACDSALPVIIHKDYGLPEIAIQDRRKTLVIADSYSGNTEETIDAFETARKQGFAVAVVSIGGELLNRAKKYGLPYVEIPGSGIQPRMGLGLNFRALLKIMRKERSLAETDRLSRLLESSSYQTMGRALAKKLQGRIPIIYASKRNYAIGYAWKIKLNETGKIPAFINVMPEMNHNEMTGFDPASKTRKLSGNFHFIFLKDTKDHPRIQLRMKVLEKLYRARKLRVEIVPLVGRNRVHTIFSSLLLADRIALYLAEHYGVESEQVPMVEEFKVLLQNFKP